MAHLLYDPDHGPNHNNTENNNDTNVYWAPTTRYHAKDPKPSITSDADSTHLKHLPSLPPFTDVLTDVENS